MIPKIIHVFWEGPLCPIVNLSISLIKDLHPEWTINMMDLSTISHLELCEGFDDLSIQAKTDWIRLTLLAEHGGVWLDASCICTKPIQEWIDMNSDELVGFAFPFDDTIIESWALACRPNHSLVLLWKEELRKAIKMGFEEYKELFPWKNSAIYNWLPYLTIHACYAQVSHDSGMVANIKSQINSDAPFDYLNCNDGDIDKAVSMLLKEPYEPHPPMIKLTGKVRDNINSHIHTIKKDSFMDKLFSMYETDVDLPIFYNYIRNIVFILIFVFCIFIFFKIRSNLRPTTTPFFSVRDSHLS